MPLFHFECSECNEKSELLVRIGEAPVCPACGSKRMEKQLSHITPLNVTAEGPSPAMCGSCGGAPGSCRFQNN